MASLEQLAAAVKRKGIRQVARVTRIPPSTVSAACGKMLDEPYWRVLSMCRAVGGRLILKLHPAPPPDVPGQLEIPLTRTRKPAKLPKPQ